EWAPFATRGTSELAVVQFRTRAMDRRRRVVSLYDAVVRTRLIESAVIGSLALRRFEEALKERNADADEYLRSLHGDTDDLGVVGPPFDADPERVLDAAVRGWVEGSRSLHALCTARSIAYVHVLQPTFHDTGSKTPTPHELTRTLAPPGYVEGVHGGYPRLRQEGQRLRSEGVDFIDGSFLFKDVKGDVYVDNCHFNDVGHRIVTDAIVRALAEQLRGAKR
ncbi:MAG TPA: hypothetical protein VKE69_05530, partial [Planctomycetota bacterium]|nr:hypothetical protein [Planctomycetota bacterium]